MSSRIVKVLMALIVLSVALLFLVITINFPPGKLSLIVKILIALIGLSAALFFGVIGLANRSPDYQKTGWIVGLTTIGIIATITLIEFLLR